MIGFGVIGLIIAHKTRKYLQSKANLINAASMVIRTNLKVLLLPALSCVCQIAYTITWLVVIAYLQSCGNIIPPKRGERDDMDNNATVDF